MEFGRIPYKIYRSLECETCDVINEQTPARYGLTSDLVLGGGSSESLSIRLWKGIPRDYREILLYHELKEAEFQFVDGLPEEESHRKAVLYHMEYAKRFLPEDKFQQFLEWQSHHKGYSVESLVE